MKALFACVCFVCFALVATPAGAAPYKGKTKGGSSITFAAKGKKVTKIKTVIPTLCLETTGGYSSKAGGELFEPVRPSVIGKTVKSEALQPAAMNFGADATKNYEVTLKQKGKKITGKLKLNFSFLVPDLFSGAKIYICNGTTTFTAAPR